MFEQLNFYSAVRNVSDKCATSSQIVITTYFEQSIHLSVMKKRIWFSQMFHAVQQTKFAYDQKSRKFEES